MLLVCLHNVIGGEADEFDRKCSRIPAAEFEGFLDKTSKSYDLVSFSQFMRRLDEGRCDPRTAALTFDDGFRGVFRYAFPILQGRGLDAGAFVNPPLLASPPDGFFHFLEIEIAFRLTQKSSATWDGLESPMDLTTAKARVKSMKQAKRRLKTMPEPDRRARHRALLEGLDVPPERIAAYAGQDEKYKTMSREEALELREAGWLIGSHTLTHRSVGWLSPTEAEEEIDGSKRMLDAILGHADPIFAYPYGEEVHFGEAAPGLCRKAGYRYAFTTIPGDIASGDDPHRLKRVDYKEFVRGYLP